MTPTVTYDTETYPNCFILCAEDQQLGVTWSFEISPWRDDSREIVEWMNWLKQHNFSMVGFNNVGFDYPIIHKLHKMGKATAPYLYQIAMDIINGSEKFAHQVYPSDRIIPQIDLYKIHHFDNKARTTSLKALEFNMRMDNISDLPFPVGTVLNQQQIEQLKKYCAHDVRATKLFLEKSAEAVEFRRKMAGQLQGDVMNWSDVKLGKMIFQNQLIAEGVECYNVGPQGRTPKQTPRPKIELRKCVPVCIKLNHPEFLKIYDTFRTKVITETKGAFKDLTANVGGLEFTFGTGGLHASVDNRYFTADDEWMILDVDVASMYPSIAIENNLYPEHLGSKFVDVYRKLRTERLSHPKGSVENAALKLALNGVYGASGDKFSIFYDPLFTMRITVGGQLMLAMLAERLLSVPDLNIIQVNTDGITMFVKRGMKQTVDAVCKEWEETTKLTLEQVEFKKMFVPDVNSYLAVKLNGEVKRKGRYEYALGWHQDMSALVIPKVAERVLVEEIPVEQALYDHTDLMDFMLRIRVPKSSRLAFFVPGKKEQRLENTQRYYVSEGGGKLVKIMPPLAGKSEERNFNIQNGYTVCPCNDVNDVKLPINYEWYRNEINKLVDCF